MWRRHAVAIGTPSANTTTNSSSSSSPPTPSDDAAAGTPTGAAPWQSASAIRAWGRWPSSKSFVYKINWDTLRTKGRRHLKEFVHGGYLWRVKIKTIHFNGRLSSEAGGWVTVCLQLLGGTDDIDMADGETAMAEYTFSLVDQDFELLHPPVTRSTSKIVPLASKEQFRFRRFVAQDALEAGPYLTDGCFRLRCDMEVHDVYARPSPAPRPVVVPPSDLPRHLLGLLRSGQGCDVAFKVGREVLAAHRFMLAARSPVFMAELLGPMAEMNKTVRVDDMEARVFKAMLEFIYTDSPPPEIAGDGELTLSVEMAQHLLVAADRYGLERLKLICEDTLTGRIDTANAAATLTLAEQHGCRGLKDACLSFLTGAPGNLQAVMASDDYKHLAVSCPSLHEAIAGDLSAALSGSHVLRIEGYTETTELLSNGECLTSVAFAVGGRRWRLEYYPDGDDPENTGWVSVILRLHHTDATVDVLASFEISLLGLDGNPVPSCNLASGSRCEFSGREGWGGGLVETEVLKLEGSGYLQDDAFSIRCDITVVK